MLRAAGSVKHFEQAYNAQAAVDTESMLIVGEHVTNAPNDVTVYASVGKQRHHKTVDELKAALNEPPPVQQNATAKEVMQNRLQSIHGRELYKLRKQTVEPVFGIII
jgi:hypothetical protein